MTVLAIPAMPCSASYVSSQQLCGRLTAFRREGGGLVRASLSKIIRLTRAAPC